MKHKISVCITSLILAMASFSLTTPSRAQSKEQPAQNPAKQLTTKDLVGTWTLISSVTEQGGTKTEPYGPNAKGIMTVDANGRYVIVAMRAGLPKFASNNRATGTPEENKAILGGSIAHFGTLSVNEAERAIILKIETATFPNWGGTEQKWPFTITGDTLHFTVPTASGGGTATTVWKRAN
jgi:hypothetical protein